jgi:pyruvate/2-oxoglutarate dehydrogenase complex dihydrolipoamide dehydrogenase (E3) component
MERYDVVVIGGGAAGINAAKMAVKLKARVALVDRGPLGGTCVNRG